VLQAKNQVACCLLPERSNHADQMAQTRATGKAVHLVDAFRDQHIDALEHAARGRARCSTSCVDRSDRLWRAVRPVTAGENDEEHTNVSPGRPVGTGACRVALGSAGHLERPQSM